MVFDFVAAYVCSFNVEDTVIETEPLDVRDITVELLYDALGDSERV